MLSSWLDKSNWNLGALETGKRGNDGQRERLMPELLPLLTLEAGG